MSSRLKKNKRTLNVRNRIKYFVKNSKLVYRCYYYLGSMFLKVIGIFIPTDENLILFVSYGGQKYDDSPRVIYEYLLKHPVSKNHKYVWAFSEPEKFSEVKNKIRIDTIKYYLVFLIII